MNSIRDAIVRDICETEPANPDSQYSVCISLQSLELILDRHLSCDDRVVAGFLQKGSLIFGANVEGELTCDCFEITFRGVRHIVPVHLTASRKKLEGALCLPEVARRDTVGELIEAARRVLDKEWEYGEEQPHCARLNDLIDKATGVCE